MKHYRRLSNGASPALPSSGGGFWGFVGNLFSGIGSINFPSSNPTGNQNILPANYIYGQTPNTQAQKSINVLPIAVGILVVAVIIKTSQK